VAESLGGMEALRIVLDTGVLFQPRTLVAARATGRPVVLPAVALAERLRHFARDRRPTPGFVGDLDQAGILVEPFGVDEASHLPPSANDDRLWARHSRDALIAAHLREGDELWTTNPRDFEALGVPAARIRAW
jgi:predicted nucleic acid-binding protein